MIRLKEPLTKAEDQLFQARLALAALEEAQKAPQGATEDADRQDYIEKAKDTLYRAMEALQGREADYFASRYIGKGQEAVLQGWKVDFKAEQFKRKLDHMLKKAEDHENAVSALNNPQALLQETDSAGGTVAAVKTGMDMFKLWYPQSQVWNKIAPSVPLMQRKLDLIREEVVAVRTDLADVKALDDSNPDKNRALSNIKYCLTLVEIAERLGVLAFRGHLELPYDLRDIFDPSSPPPSF